MPGPLPGVGSKSFIQIAPETAYGVGGTSATGKLEVISMNLEPGIGVIQDPSLYNAQSRRALYQGGLTVKGTITFRCNYEGLLEIFRGAFGTYSATAVSGDATVNDHVFKEGQLLKTYRIEVMDGDVPSSTLCQVITGAKFTRIMIKGTSGQGTDAMLQVEITLIAKSMTTGQSRTGSLSFPAIFPVLYHQAITTDDGSVDGGLNSITTAANCATTSGNANLTRAAGDFVVDGVRVGMLITATGVPANTYVGTVASTSIGMVKADGTGQNATATGSSLVAVFATSLRTRSFTLTIENPHDEARFYLGALNIDEPIRNDFIKATWQFTEEFANINMLNAAMNFTGCNPQLIFRHPTTIGTASKREFELRSNQANITSYTKPIQGMGVIIATATLEAFNDPTDLSAVVARFRTLEAALP